MVPALLGLALLMLWGAWTTRTRDGSSSSAGVPVTVSRGPTVAVLPFGSDTGDSEQNTLAEGLTQGMISALGRFGELRVLARGVSDAYRGRIANTIDIGRTLGADYAVDGNVRRDDAE